MAKKTQGKRPSKTATPTTCEHPQRPPLERPGEFPFTRGLYPEMYRTRLWTMRQYAGFGSAAETNRRFRYLLEHGETGLSLAFDLPTQMGYDSDHPLAEGEVGRAGVAINSIHDMQRCFDGIPLDKVTTSMTINAPAAILLSMYASIAKRQGVEESVLGGTVQNDLLKEYVARGTFIFPPEPSMRLCVDILEYCGQRMLKWNPISVSGYHIREAGCTAAQEIGFTLANGLAYLEASRQRGLELSRIARQVSFFFGVHNNFLEEVAKFRAARRLWAKLCRERFGLQDDRACMLRFHAQTCGSTLTAQQPENNVVRVTLQALAAVLGGAQSLHTNSRDEALGLPTAESVKIALRTQQILAFETGIPEAPDPFGGSYHIEEATDRLASDARAIIEEVDKRGGSVQAIRDGYFQREIHRSAYQQQQAMERGDSKVVGVNSFQETDSRKLEIQSIPEETRKEQLKRLKALRKKRRQSAVQRSLDALRRAAKGRYNLVPVIRECVDAEATVGEICGAMAEVFGRYGGE